MDLLQPLCPTCRILKLAEASIQDSLGTLKTLRVHLYLTRIFLSFLSTVMNIGS